MNALRITPVKVLDTNSVKVYFSSLNFLRSKELMLMIILPSNWRYDFDIANW